METLVVAAVAAALGFWTLRPLFSPDAGREEEPADQRIETLVENKSSVYRTLLDLEMDHKMGKLDDADYELLRDESKVEALGLIRQIEATAGAAGSDGDTTLEQEINQARARLRGE